MKDQKSLWNQVFSNQVISSEESIFCKEIRQLVKARSHILELRCGNGQDAVAFANDGHNVVAIDFSESVIERNKKYFKDISNIRLGSRRYR